MADQRRFLRIYLNDHLMGSSGGIELARRCLRNNRGSSLAVFLEKLLADIIEDRAVVEGLMATLGFPRDRIKVAASHVGERLGRLKLNGQIVGYSPLSRLVELEGLCAGVELKLCLWRTLQRIASTDERIAAMDLDGLIERASSQRQALERHRLEAADQALGQR